MKVKEAYFLFSKVLFNAALKMWNTYLMSQNTAGQRMKYQLIMKEDNKIKN